MSRLPTLKAKDFWAKTTPNGEPGMSVVGHSINAGAVAEALLSCYPDHIRTLFPNSVATIVALHDIGKISVGFARKCQAWVDKHQLQAEALTNCWYLAESNHAKTSQALLQPFLGYLATAEGSHHGRVLGRNVKIESDYSAAELEDARKELRLLMERYFGPLPLAISKTDDSKLWLVAGLITICDWIASNADFFPEDRDLEVEEARKIAQALIKTLGFSNGVHKPLSFDQIFPFQPNSLQSFLFQQGNAPGLFIIEGSMGCGKTEAALGLTHQLILNHQNHGVYFGLPTQVTSNRIHTRVAAFLGTVLADTARLRLAHSMSWMQDTFDLQLGASAAPIAKESRSWFASGKRALLAQYGVGTIDQALQGVVKAKHFFVRRCALAGKVIILDEVHSYDLYTGTLITTLIRELLALNCSVIILSATLTQQRRTELLQAGGFQEPEVKNGDYPLITIARRQERTIMHSVPWNEHKTIQVKTEAFSQDQILSSLVSRAEAGQNVLYIRNTVAEAQEAYQKITAQVREGMTVGLLHSRFPYFQRSLTENFWLDKLGKNREEGNGGSILIATQVVEQSVDIDLDFIISDMAPMDMLLQRMGRLWRHERADRRALGRTPEFWVNLPPLDETGDLKKQLGKSAKVYAPYVLLRTMRVLKDKTTIVIPADIRPLIEDTYREDTEVEPLEWQPLKQDVASQKAQMENLALNAASVFSRTDNSDDEERQTRLSELPTKQVVLIRETRELGKGAHHVTLLDGTSIKLNEYEWQRTHAKTIFSNVVHLPAWMVPHSTPPHWLDLYVPGMASIVQIKEDGTSSPPGLLYTKAYGIQTAPNINK